MRAKKAERPSFEEWQELATKYNGVDLAKRLGVPTGTITRWGRHYKLMPLFRCRRCQESKPRDAFVTDKICFECDAKDAVGSADGFRVCVSCGRRKALSHDNWYRAGRDKRLWDSTCKVCRNVYFRRRNKAKWAEHKAEMQQLEEDRLIKLRGAAEWAARPIARPVAWIEEVRA